MAIVIKTVSALGPQDGRGRDRLGGRKELRRSAAARRRCRDARQPLLIVIDAPRPMG